ncbi:serine hydrolase domain-containing protein [Microbulbifer epialgicus]|uniref:Serine hydrolase domain-containing protein n=1 Tax=Microbulbifer epialgicus TaxID=393907 RepID=A0ABV4NX63_9GAMM
MGSFRYSNYNYNILTALTDKQLGKSWKDIIDDEIFSKAGMTRSSAYISKAQNLGWSIAHPHDTFGLNKPKLVNSERLKTDATMQSAGGVIMSAGDAVKWLEFMVEDGRIGGHQVFSKEAVVSTVRPYVKVNKKYGKYERNHYGLGWYIGKYEKDVLIHHFGGFSGARSHVSFMPDRKIGVAVFINDSEVGNPLADVIANYIYDSLIEENDAEENYKDSLEEAIKRRQVAKERLAASKARLANRPSTLSLPLDKYVGKYSSIFGESIAVEVNNGKLHFVEGDFSTPTTPYTKAESVRFNHISGLPMVMKFSLDQNGDVYQLLLVDEIYKRERLD